MQFIHSFSSEWLKTRRTASSWLVVLGALLIPFIILIARIVNYEDLYQENISNGLWHGIMDRCWQFMATFLLPMGVILATSLITQNEFRNNTWKQLHTTPQSLHIIFLTKLSVILIMLLQFFVLYNIGIYAAGVVPGLFFADVPWPIDPYPFGEMFRSNAIYFACCLPVIATQFLISMQFRNFLIPLGAGIGLLVSALIALSWKYGYIHPYVYTVMHFVSSQPEQNSDVNILNWSLAYFVIISSAAYVLYLTKREKA